jgi:riboflavin biosynthesis pyrimidine reductase
MSPGSVEPREPVTGYPMIVTVALLLTAEAHLGSDRGEWPAHPVVRRQSRVTRQQLHGLLTQVNTVIASTSFTRNERSFR